MSPGVSIRTSFLPVLFAPKIPHGSEPRCDDMVRYTKWASEDLARHFAVESDELRLKTNVRGGPLSARYCRYQRANSGFALARTEGQRITRPRVTNDCSRR